MESTIRLRIDQMLEISELLMLESPPVWVSERPRWAWIVCGPRGASQVGDESTTGGRAAPKSTGPGVFRAGWGVSVPHRNALYPLAELKRISCN
jgi:hypothetical protein